MRIVHIFYFCMLNIPGKLVPNATKVIDVTESLRPIVQPNPAAMSPIKAVITPIIHIDTTNATQPPAKSGKRVYHQRDSIIMYLFSQLRVCALIG